MWGEVIFAAVSALILCFGFVVLFGAPYLPTLKPQVEQAFQFLDLQPGQTLLELGCGDGRVVLAAAERGLTVVGYELNPLLVVIARLRTWRYRRQVRVHWANYWVVTWPPADAVYGFILPKYMSKLDKKVMQSFRNPVKVVSFAFAIPGKKPVRSAQGIFLYDYR